MGHWKWKGHIDSYTNHQNKSKHAIRVVEKKAEMEVLLSTLIWTQWLFKLLLNS